MAVTSLLDTSLPETVLSEEKSQAIIDLIKERFNETDHAPVARQKEALLEGDRSDETHMMSRKMMQTYISSYWYHFNEQVPICKSYSFFASNCTNFLKPYLSGYSKIPAIALVKSTNIAAKLFAVICIRKIFSQSNIHQVYVSKTFYGF